MPMNSKIGNKSFADRKDANFITKDSGIKTMSAIDEEKLNGQAIGDVLNKISDPNWVDPKKKIRAVGDQQMDKNAFMKLMLTQMKNQDPTSPIQAHEMAAQLAAFSSVEQLQNLNTTMQDMKKEQSPVVNFEALNFIGKTASGDSSEVLRLKDDKTHELKFSLPKDGSSASLKIRNSQGETIRTLELKDLKAGDNSVMWNGQDDTGSEAPADTYQIFIEAKDKMEQKMVAQTKFDGVITGVNFSAQGPILIVGNQSIPLADIKKIIDPRIVNPDLQKTTNDNENKIGGNKKEDVKIDDLSSNTPEQNKQQEVVSKIMRDAEKMKKITAEMSAKESKNSKTEVAKETMGTGNLENVSISRKVAEKVEKETGKEISI